MTQLIWKYTNSDNTVVWREWPDGRQESCLVTTPEVQNWIASGNTPEPADPPPSEPTIQEKLQSVGLNIDDLKAALGIK